MTERTIDMMPGLREQAQDDDDFRVTEDGSITLSEGVESAELTSRIDVVSIYDHRDR